jgi:hypothetical protein
MFLIHETWMTMMPIREAVISKMITGKILFIVTKIAEQGGFYSKQPCLFYFLTKVLHRKGLKSRLPACNKDFELPI